MDLSGFPTASQIQDQARAADAVAEETEKAEGPVCGCGQPATISVASGWNLRAGKAGRVWVCTTCAEEMR